MSQSKSNTARVYTRSGVRISLASVEGDPHAELRKVHGGAISGVNAASGDRVTVRAEEIVSVETAQHLPDPGILWGRRFEVRSAHTMVGVYNRGIERGEDPDDFDHERDVARICRDIAPERLQSCAVLIAEDMASDVVLIYDLAADEPIWLNEASSPAALELQVQAVKLLALGEAVEVAFQEQDEERRVFKGPATTHTID